MNINFPWNQFAKKIMNVQIFREIDLQNSLINLVHLIVSHGNIILRIRNSENNFDIPGLFDFWMSIWLPYLFLCNTKLWTILIFSEVENSYRYIDTTTWRGVPLLQRFNGLSLEAKFFRDEKLVVDIGLGNHLLWIVDTKMTIYKKKIKIKNLILKLCYARTPH